MGKEQIVCSNCGKQLAPTDKFCPQCGVKVERQDAASAANPTVICIACGHSNSRTNTYCESCGAKLVSEGVGEKKSKRSEKEPVPQKKSKSTAQSSGFKFEIWHYVVVAVLLAAAGYFAYDEFERDSSLPKESAQSAPFNFPSQQAPPSPPSKDILNAISRLEETVKNNPGDSGAKLLLANALHDGAIHDGSLFPRAIEAYRNYLKDKPGDPNARVDLGICYFELGKIDSVRSAGLFTQAIDEMEQTLKNNPKHQAGAFNLGIVYLYSGDMRDSNKWLKKAFELNPESELGKRAKAILEQHGQVE